LPDQPAEQAVRPGKRLALFLDGTWNTVSTNTNIWRLRALCAPADRNGVQQRIYYTAGLGTKRGEKVRGGMFGHGLTTAVTDAYEWLIENYDPGDDFFIFGFSRGAYTARSLNGLLSKCGLLVPGAPLGVSQLFRRYRRGGEPMTIRELLFARDQGKTDFTLEEQWVMKYSVPVQTKFIGVFDTVGALGIPGTSLLGASAYRFLNTGIRTSNDFAFHALAIDEHREAFLPTLWTKAIPKPPKTDPIRQRTVEQVEQRWFVGAHANVGGGCESDSLAQLPLKWIMAKAELHGLAFRGPIAVDAGVLQTPIFDSFGQFMYGAYRLAKLGRPYYRAINGPPKDLGDSFDTPINETIDASVFDRWRADPDYRPPNLAAWAARQRIDPEHITMAVRADNPATAVLS
jgi:uncharacterized protein (DUF2235 family)